jgi:benzoylformate decarboxylase
MAEGHALATGELAAANVHVQPGIANALSGILNASRTHAPLLVTVGQQVSELLAGEPFLGGDVAGLARPLAKAVFEPRSPRELQDETRRAIATALSPPRGPVVLILPLEVQAGSAPPRFAPLEPVPAPAPPEELLDVAAEILRASRTPAIVAGDGVGEAGARAELALLAERLGAPVFGEPMGGGVPLAWNHPLWAGPLLPFGSDINAVLSAHDVVLAVGMPVFRLFGHSPQEPLPARTRLVHIDVDRHEVGKSYAPAAALVGDPRAALGGLLGRLSAGSEIARRRAVEARLAERRRTLRQSAVLAREGAAVTPAAFAGAVAGAVGPNDLVVDEAITSTRTLRAQISRRRPGTWLSHRGSALGWGLPAAVGAAMARPGRRVMSLHGDGSLVFGVDALWTAAQEGTPIALAVADNRGYEILRAGLEGLTGTPQASWPGLWVEGPRLDLPGLVRAHGASVSSVEDPVELRDAFADLWKRAAGGPAALVVRVSGRTPKVGHPLP